MLHLKFILIRNLLNLCTIYFYFDLVFCYAYMNRPTRLNLRTNCLNSYLKIEKVKILFYFFSPGSVILIKGLQPNTSYVMDIRATNEVGAGGQHTVNVTTMQVGRHPHTTSLSNTVHLSFSAYCGSSKDETTDPFIIT